MSDQPTRRVFLLVLLALLSRQRVLRGRSQASKEYWTIDGSVSPWRCAAMRQGDCG